MSGASLGTVGANKVATECLNANVSRDYRQFVPGGRPPRLGTFAEVPFSFWGKVMAAAMTASACLMWANRRLYTVTVSSMEPEFQDAARKIGPVAERTDAPPVFLNPISNRIPGYYRGPDDIADAQ
eukprot:GHRR01002166.1.p1 GENE.GHRR01002166.1~~GHRR01002166.1.p1  ORF type:complete len:126 (+),score=43.53 GHRR01002166.1:166-543(+)